MLVRWARYASGPPPSSITRTASATGESLLSVLVSEVDRKRSVGRLQERRFVEMSPPHRQQNPLLCFDLGDDSFRTAGNQSPHDVRQSPPKTSDSDAGGDARADEDTHGREAASGDEHLPPATTAELVAITPGGKFGTLGLTDTHQRRSIAHLGEADVVGRDAATRIAVQLLGELDRFPPILERSEIPALTVLTDDPQPALGGVERQPLPDRERFERLVRAKRFVAEQAGGIHMNSESSTDARSRARSLYSIETTAKSI
jgi:hypothetical protein